MGSKIRSKNRLRSEWPLLYLGRVHAPPATVISHCRVMEPFQLSDRNPKAPNCRRPFYLRRHGTTVPRSCISPVGSLSGQISKPEQLQDLHFVQYVSGLACKRVTKSFRHAFLLGCTNSAFSWSVRPVPFLCMKQRGSVVQQSH